MAATREEILESIASMSVMDVVKLIEEMEEKFNVTAQAAMPMMAPAAGGAEAAAEQTEFDVNMTSFGGNKIAVIKAIRAITGLGLKEAKELVEKAPTSVKSGIDKSQAEEIKKTLEEAGASVELK